MHVFARWIGLGLIFTFGLMLWALPGLAEAPSPKAVIETKFGSMELEFFPQKAPKHVENFINLAKSGFYDGTIFHRVIPNFMIQGGDPNTKETDKSKYGMGGPEHNVKAEFNDTPHERGILSMARSRHPDSAGSQFFIMVSTAKHLDGQYTAFGRVVKGMEVADKIVAQKRDSRDNPLERIEMKVVVIEADKWPGGCEKAVKKLDKHLLNMTILSAARRCVNRRTFPPPKIRRASPGQ